MSGESIGSIVTGLMARQRVMTPEETAKRDDEERREKFREWVRRLESAIDRTNIPQTDLEYVRSDKVALASPPALVAMRAAIEWWRAAPGGMVCVVSGPFGTTKSTSLARVIARNKAAHDTTGWFATARDMIATPTEGKTTRGKDHNGEPIWIDYAEAWEKWGSYQLLGIDDVGRERIPQGREDWLVTLLEDRYDDGLATIVTTNLDAEKFATRYPLGGRLRSRLLNGQGHAGEPTGFAWWHAVKGDDLRNPKARAEFIASQAKGDA